MSKINLKSVIEDLEQDLCQKQGCSCCGHKNRAITVLKRLEKFKLPEVIEEDAHYGDDGIVSGRMSMRDETTALLQKLTEE